MFEPAIPYRKKAPVASVPAEELICWNCFGTDIKRVPHLREAEHSHVCNGPKGCGATGAIEDFRGVASTAAIVNRRRRA
jgi:hypothetical protein